MNYQYNNDLMLVYRNVDGLLTTL